MPLLRQILLKKIEKPRETVYAMDGWGWHGCITTAGPIAAER